MWGAVLPLLSSLLGHQLAARRVPPVEGQLLAVGMVDAGKAPAAPATFAGVTTHPRVHVHGR